MDVIHSKLVGGLVERPVEVALYPHEFVTVSGIIDQAKGPHWIDDFIRQCVRRNIAGKHKYPDAVRFRATQPAYPLVSKLFDLLQQTSSPLETTTIKMTPKQFREHKQRYPVACIFKLL